MGLTRHVSRLRRFFTGLPLAPEPNVTSSRIRICRVEPMESRRLMAADLHLGSVYFEEASGDDSDGDTFYITFQGGAAGTQLSQLVIDGDKLGDGLTIGDAFFDITAGGAGSFGSYPFTVISSDGIQITNVSVADGGTKLIFTFSGFDAGERLAFKIDVDEQGFDDSSSVTEGSEFAGSILTGTFTHANYETATVSFRYRDAYDSMLAQNATQSGQTLNLPPDSYMPPHSVDRTDRTAGGSGVMAQVPKPITLGGNVFYDANLNNSRDGAETGISGVTLELLTWNGSSYVSSGRTATTDAQGNYHFDGLLPGRYRVVESQPSGYMSVGAKAGAVGGTTRGAVASSDILSEIDLVGGENSVSNDFAEALPATLAGNVYHDRNNNGIREAGEEGIGGSTIVIQPLVVLGSNTSLIEVTTAADGSWSVTGLAPGQYRVYQKSQPTGYLDGLDTPGNAGGTATNPGDEIAGISLASGQNGTQYNFGELRPSTISGRVWADKEGNCTFQPTDTPLAGVTIRLLSSTGQVIATTTTNAQGEYEFVGLRPGTYGIQEVQPTGYFQGASHVGSAGGAVSSTDNITAIVLTSGTSGVRYDFCENVPLTLSGYVYVDRNNNGQRESGEAPIGGVRLHLLDANGNRTGVTTTTDANGYYRFEGLAAGTYGVAEDQPAGYLDGIDTPGNSGGTAQNPGDKIVGAALTYGKNGEQYNFGEISPASISGRVHADLDGDCILDPNERGIQGVLIELLDSTGRVIATTRTDANGLYSFEGLPPGTYGVHEVQPNGYYDGGDFVGSAGGTKSANDTITQIALGSGVRAVDYNFCEKPPSSISGRVHADLDGDCEYDPGERGIAGVLIELLDENGNVVATTRTDANGEYKFENLRPGEYGIHEVQPAGYYDGGDKVGSVGGVKSANDTITAITLLPGVTAVRYDFCEKPPTSISGRVHADLDGDCEYDPNEQGIEGVLIELLGENGNVIATTRTNAQGFYSFEGLPPGTYGIHEVQPAGYYDGGDKIGSAGGVKNANDTITQIELLPGTAAVHYDFCEKQPASITGRVHADLDGDCEYDPNEQGIEGVLIELLDEDGNVVATTRTNAAGIYKFDNLQPGNYGIREIQPAGYYDGGDFAGSAGGTRSANDKITGIELGAAVNAVNYNFCEKPPASIAGRVHADLDGDCTYDPNEQGIQGVLIELLDANGNVVATTRTDAEGLYKFDNLRPGVEYGVREVQPAGFYDGGERAGSAGGVVTNDKVTKILLGAGVNAVNYDFCEKPPASIAGRVHADLDGDCTYDANERGIEGVLIELLDADGNVVATTRTDANGLYKFDNLRPGVEHGIREVQPAGFYDGGERAGSAGGLVTNDKITKIVLGAGVNAVNYDFCEKPPASLSGRVHADLDGDCKYDPNEQGIQGVVIELLDADGNVIRTTTTNADGIYKFENLRPGVQFTVREVQPEGYFDGGQRPGSAGGEVIANDTIGKIVLDASENAVNYNFCEKLPASISGYVYVDQNNNGYLDGGEDRIGGVTLELLDANGARTGIRTRTATNGFYRFEGLRPGTYGVMEVQPAGYEDGLDRAGSAGGSAHNPGDRITGAQLTSGLHATAYNFGERPMARISGYVYQDGATLEIIDGDPDFSDYDGQRTGDDRPLSGVVLQLGDRYGNLILDNQGRPITVVTDANGYYEFTGLNSGVYSIRQVQPTGFIDHLDTAGATGGFGVNDGSGLPDSLRDQLNAGALASGDAIVWIVVGTGGHSRENNFSEVDMERLPPPIPPYEPPAPEEPRQPGGYYSSAELAYLQSALYQPTTPVYYSGSSGISAPSWHLSVVDAGFPRGTGEEGQGLARLTSAAKDEATWSAMDLTSSQWILHRGQELPSTHLFGREGAIPVTGDFNGDGTTEMGVYIDGEWYIDVNGNGEWDAEDLWAKLGTRDDRPVVGDWDGDGKDDIGIFGQAWAGDPKAIRAEPGIPGPLSHVTGAKKNMPPKLEDATMGERELKLSATGKLRSELIDHVFSYGKAGDHPVTGDWSGDGIDTIAVFNAGTWNLDVDGDGRYGDADLSVKFGQAGDVPVVGDWNGDGIEDLGVFRDGKFLLDSNGNRQLDAHDAVFAIGQAGDLPVVGDWNADGMDEVGVYRNGTMQASR